MSTDQALPPTSTEPRHPPADPVRAARASRPRSGRAGRWLFRLFVLGVLVANGWWYVRNTRPLPDLREIQSWVARGDYERSDPALREHLRRSPHHDEARMLLARSLAAREDFLACAEELHEVPFWSPRKAEALFLEGSSYIRVHRAREAEAAWRACIVDDPLHPVPWDYLKGGVESLIELYALEQRWEEAHEVVWRMYDEVEPYDRENVLIMRLRMEVERIESETAAVQLRAYLDADPGNVPARRALARYEQALGNGEEALRQFRICLEISPESPDVWSDYLQLLKDRGDLDALAAAVASLPEAAGSTASAWEVRGLLHESAGDYEQAAEAYRKSVELEPNESETRYRLGLALGRLGRRDEGRVELDRSKAIQQVRATLLDHFQDFHAATAPNTPRGEEFRQAARILADDCRTLGITRVADELDAMIARSRAS